MTREFRSAGLAQTNTQILSNDVSLFYTRGIHVGAGDSPTINYNIIHDIHDCYGIDSTPTARN